MEPTTTATPARSAPDAGSPEPAAGPAPLGGHKRLGWRSLKTRVTLLALAIFLAGIWSLASYASRLLREDMQNLLGDQQFSTASFIADNIGQDLNDRLQALEKTAGLAAPAMRDGPPAVQAMLDRLPVFQTLFNGGVVALLPNGTAIAETAPAAGRVGSNYIGVDSVATALGKGKASIGRPIVGKMLRVPIIDISVPIRDGRGQTIGALSGIINLDKPNFLDAFTRRHQGKYAGHFLLVAPQYRLIVTASDKRRIMEVLPAPGINPSIDKFIDGYEGFDIVDSPSGTQVLAAAKRVPAAGWYVAVLLPTAEAFAPIRAMQRRVLLAAIALSLLVCALIWWMLKRQLSPMLAAASAMVARNDPAQMLLPLPVARRDEVGELIEGFNRLLKILAQRDAALEESKALYERAVNGANDGIWEWIPATGEGYLSPRWKRLLGYEDDELPNVEASFFAAVHPDDSPLVEEAIRAHFEERHPYAAEFRMRCKSGEYRWFQSRGQAIWDGDGRPLRMSGSITDITESRLALAKIQRVSRLYALLSQCNQTIVRSTGSGDLFPRLCRDAVVFGGMKMAWIGAVDETGRNVRPVASFGEGQEYLAGLRIGVDAGDPFGLEPTGTAIRERRACWCQDFLGDPRTAPWRERGAKFGWAASASLPLSCNGIAAGVFTLYAGEPQAFDDDIRNLLLELVSDIDFALTSYDREAARLATERALRDSEARVRSIFDQASDAIFVVSSDNRFLEVNSRGLEMTGYTHEEFLGLGVADILAPEERPRLDVEPVAMMSGTPHLAEWLHRRKDGSTFPAEVSARKLDDISYLAIVRDISERKRVGDELRKLSLAVEQSPECIVITGRDARIEYANAAFYRVTGYSASEVIGQNPRILQSGRTPKSTYDALWRELLQGNSWKGVFFNKRKDGTEYVEFANISPIRQPAGNVSHYVAVKEDITEKERMTEELDAYRNHLEELVEIRTRELGEAKRAAETANAAKSAFVANMSHEIRTPMNAIIGLTHLLRNDVAQPAQQDKLAKIADASHHLLSVINDILDFSKIEADKLHLDIADFAFDRMLDNVISMIGSRAREKRLEIAVDRGDLPPVLVGDSTRLAQALLNYLSNAVKFTERGKIALRFATVEETAGDLLIRFEVADSGIGIEPSKLPGLFAAFEQADAGTSRRYGGTGLGLAITRRLSALMGGEAGARSVPGRGSTFWFTARLGKSKVSPAELAEPVGGLPAAKHVGRTIPAGMRILLAEDNPVNQEVAVALLNEAGVGAEIANDGREALEMARHGRYDLILMDMQMPGMDGLEATRAIRALPGWSTIPILAMTANAFDEDRRRCQVAGMDDFVAKPVDPEQLYAMLRRWLPAATRARSRLAATTGAPLAELAAIPGLDAAQGLGMLRGRAPGYVRLLRLFAADHDEYVRRLRQGVAAEDRREARLLAHSLKGSAGSLGITGVRHLAGKLEAAIVGGRGAATLERLAGAVEQEFVRVTTAILAALPAEAGAVDPRDVDWAAVRQVLAELEPLLEAGNVRAGQIVESGAPMLRAALGSLGVELEQRIGRFLYTEALATLALARGEHPQLAAAVMARNPA